MPDTGSRNGHIEVDRPHPAAQWCLTCECWYLSFVTRVLIPGWRLCSGHREGKCCSDANYQNVDWPDIPFEDRRIHYVGGQGSRAEQRVIHREDPGGLAALENALK